MTSNAFIAKLLKDVSSNAHQKIVLQSSMSLVLFTIN